MTSGHLQKSVMKKGAVLVADGAQSVPHMPVDVQDLDVDFSCLFRT